jgi:hypothetical protein
MDLPLLGRAETGPNCSGFCLRWVYSHWDLDPLSLDLVGKLGSINLSLIVESDPIKLSFGIRTQLPSIHLGPTHQDSVLLGHAWQNNLAALSQNNIILQYT